MYIYLYSMYMYIYGKSDIIKSSKEKQPKKKRRTYYEKTLHKIQRR